MKHRVDENGFYLDSYSLDYPYFEENWILTEIPLTGSFSKRKLVDGVWVEGAAPEELAIELQKIYNQKYIEIANAYNLLWVSSLARATGKTGKGLTEDELNKIREEYIDVKNIAERHLNGENMTSNEIFDNMLYETENDFTGQILYDTANYFGLDISGERIDVYCRIVLEKFRLGEDLWKLLKGFCRTFRSKMITLLDKGNTTGLEQGFELMKQLSNEADIEDIQDLLTQFKAV